MCKIGGIPFRYIYFELHLKKEKKKEKGMFAFMKLPMTCILSYLTGVVPYVGNMLICSVAKS